MVETVIRLLIGLCLLVLAVFLILWVLAQLGLAIPAMVVKVLWVIVVLIAILMIVRALRPFAGGWLP